MTAALILLGVLVVANLIIWGTLLARALGVPAVRIAAHPGRHASTERIRCGGRITDQVMPRKQTAGHPPWHTAGQPVLVPQMRDELPVYGEKSQLQVLAAVREGLLTPGGAEAQRLAKAWVA